MRKLFPFIFILVLFVFDGLSQTKKDTLGIEQALSRYSVNSPLFSPDGMKAVVVVSQTGAGEHLPSSHIWLVDVASKSIRQFTNSQKSESYPRWSPDGKQLAFLSARDGETQVYLMDMNGGEALQLTQSKTGIRSFEWNPSGKTIAYLAEDAPPEDTKKRIADKYDERVMSESEKPTRIFIIDLTSKQTTTLKKQNRQIHELKWMPSGEELLLVAEILPSTEIPKLELVKFSLKDSAVTVIPSPVHSSWGNVVIAPNGNSFVYQGARTDGPVPHDLFIESFSNALAQNITAKSLDLPIFNCKFINNHNLLATVQKGFSTRLYNISDSGEAIPYGLNQNILAFDVSVKGDLMFESFSAAHPSEIWLLGADKKPVQVSHFNKAFDSLSLIKPGFLTYKSFDGTMIEAALYKPAVSSSKPLPLVVFIHGGPTGAFSDSYSAWVQLFVRKGYAVFCPNIRGSTGYGWKFLTSNRNDWGGGDFKDIMAGVDMLVAKENIDAGRMGISGWSYGGYMAEWAITQTNRFKAAMSGAGLANLASEFGTENGPAYDHWFFGTPYEHLDDFIKHSPITYIKNAKTPTLIIQGENDQTDPVGQSQELYRGLRFNNVPAELVLYPREPHGFREIKHNIDFYARMLAWFDKYVLDSVATEGRR